MLVLVFVVVGVGVGVGGAGAGDVDDDDVLLLLFPDATGRRLFLLGEETDDAAGEGVRHCCHPRFCRLSGLINSVE